MAVKILNGNELLVQGGLEAGFHLYTGYPGSPLADFFSILHERKDELRAKGVRVVLANSEAHAAAMASGAKMAGQDVMVAMKSMGLHVASDALSVGNFANPGPTAPNGEKAGVVVVVGDDPWSMSTSTPADSRYLFKHLHIPFLEPSTPQELKDWVGVALELSRESSVYVGLLLTTAMAEGGGRVEVGAERAGLDAPVTLQPGQFNLSEHVMVPPNSLIADARMLQERFPRYLQVLAKKGLDRIFGNPAAKLGLVASGGTFEMLKQVLEASCLMPHLHLYKCAGSYALDKTRLVPFLKAHQRVVVVEEKRGFLESQISEIFAAEQITTELWGKNFGAETGFPAHGGLSFELIHRGISRVLELSGADASLAPLTAGMQLEIAPAKRLPTFCPGCPHRETLSLLKEIRADLATQNVQLISHGDVGCYSLSFLEPFKEMHDLSAMGQGGALGAGTDLFTTNPSVVLMGDSTFFHSGMTAISNSVQLGHDITYILLDNDNTAMTGHQVTPVSGVSVEGTTRPRQDMLKIAQSLQVAEAVEVNPSDRFFYKNLLGDFLRKPGVKVIVSNKECGLTFHGRQKREDRTLFAKGGTQPLKSFYQINTDVCEDCRACVEMTGCPGLTQVQEAYGSKVAIDPQICVADSYCTKLKACPSFELVEVADYRPGKVSLDVMTMSDLPAPQTRRTLEQVAEGHDWRAIVIGVGGSGVTTISRVLAEAAKGMGGRTDLDFKFVDQKGLAQRNGSVVSHLSLFSKQKSHGQTVPEAGADVVVSPDLLEGARGLPFLSTSGVLVADDEYQIPLTMLLDDETTGKARSREELIQALESKLADRLVQGPFKSTSQELFQRPVYASAMLLGVMYQKGLLPFGETDLREAFACALPSAEFTPNWQAFQHGRRWSLLDAKGRVDDDADEKLKDLVSSVEKVAYPWQNPQRFVNMFNHYRRELEKIVPTAPTLHLARFVHDLIVYDQGQNLHAFSEDVRALMGLSLSEDELSVALRTLAKTYWVKDEVFVAHLMTTPSKTKADHRRYGRMGSSFRVRHINRPSFDVFGKKLEFDFSPRRWMLEIMRKLRILRLVMPQWHRQEKNISERIRHELLNQVSKLTGKERWERLKRLENVKGYREVRYAKALATWGGHEKHP